jgi:serine/threonine protein kinase
MGATDQARFGPFVLGARVARRRDLELHHATFFGADGHPKETMLRRTRACADGANEAVLDQAAHYALLQHTNVLNVVDFGALEGRTYVATEHVVGHNLLRVLGRCGQQKLGFPTDVALYVMQCILRALDRAHRLEGVHGPIPFAHGDLCHTNVLISMEGDVQVADFGLALASTRRRSPRGVNIGLSKGYSCYLAPEQCRGELATPASDIFQAGIVLYELVTGHVLFGSSKEQTLLDRLTGGNYPVPLERFRPDLHPDLRAIILRALAARPEDRFEDARAFLVAIQKLVECVEVRLDALFARRLMDTLFQQKRASL